MATFTVQEIDATFGNGNNEAQMDNEIAGRMLKLEKQIENLSLALSTQMMNEPLITSTPQTSRVNYQQPTVHQQQVKRPNKPIVRPPTFNGKQSWEDYKVQFDMVSKLNCWGDEERASHLAVSLTGDASSILSDMESADRINFEKLCLALSTRYGTEQRVELHRSELRNKTRLSNETLPELAHAIQRLTRLSYPSMPSESREIIAKDAFLDSLNDQDLRWGVCQARPKSFQEAVNIACELDSHRRIDSQRQQQKHTAVRTVANCESSNCTSFNTRTLANCESSNCTSDNNNIDSRLSKLEEMMTFMCNQAKARSYRGIPGKCWTCGDVGHMSRSCPQKTTNEKSGAISGADNKTSGNAPQPN